MHLKSHKFKPMNFSSSNSIFWFMLAGALFGSLPLQAAEIANDTPETMIWFDAPAKDFTESSPMGNGRLGAMMFGGVNDERIVLNESSVWSGSRQDADRPDAYKACQRFAVCCSKAKMRMPKRVCERELHVPRRWFSAVVLAITNMVVIRCLAICI